jgi:hypothetical protein
MADRTMAQLPGIRDYDLVQKDQDRYELLLKGTFEGRETHRQNRMPEICFPACTDRMADLRWRS